MECLCCNYALSKTVLIGSVRDSFTAMLVGEKEAGLLMGKTKFMLLENNIVKCPKCFSVFDYKTEEILNNTITLGGITSETNNI